jgi:hypothetical protein
MDIAAIRHRGCDDTLRRAERLLFWGVGSALAYLLLVIAQPTGETSVHLSLFGITVETTTARVLTAGLSWIVGFFAAFEIQRVQLVLKDSGNDSELLGALRYSPVSATSPTPVIAFGPAFAAAATLFTAFLVGSVGNEHRDVGERIFVALILTLPYLATLAVVHNLAKLLNSISAT